MFIAALFTIANTGKQPEYPSIDEWIKKWCIYTIKYDSAMKKNAVLLCVTAWMDLVGIMPSEIRQRQIPGDFSYMWTLKNKINKQNRNKVI